MKIGLIDVDGRHFPNLALMRLAAWHKAQGDTVEWWEPLYTYDRVYASKVFTFSPDVETIIRADEIVRGGTGYKLYDDLPPEIETIAPDYALYPSWTPAIGFLTRGCIRSCPWCIVPRKEGAIRPASRWQEIKRSDSRDLILMDNNVLAHPWGLEQIESMGGSDIRVDFNQALDARLITPEIAKLLARLHWIRFLRLACDTSEMLPVIEQATFYLREAGISPWRFWAYALVQDVGEAARRVEALDRLGVTAFAQPYRDFEGGEPTRQQKDFARWCNMRAVHRSIPWEEYRSRRSKNGKEDENASD
jgi:hypothetical protein